MVRVEIKPGSTMVSPVNRRRYSPGRTFRGQGTKAVGERRRGERFNEGHHVLPSNYSSGATFSTASLDVTTGYTSKSMRSLQFFIHSSSRARSCVSINW